MNFKEWLILIESLDPNLEIKLTNFINNPKNSPDKRKEAEDELNRMKSDPNPFDNATAFANINSILNIKNKDKPKIEEDLMRKNWKEVKGSTDDEIKTYDYFKNQNQSNQLLQEMMELLRKFIEKKLITIKFEKNKPVLIKNTIEGKEKLDSKDFTKFIDALHQVRDSLITYSGTGNYFNPIEEEINHKPNLAAKGDKVWVFKGHMPDLCRLYGKNQRWCISSGALAAAHWFSYRINHHQIQYFVFDFNKDESDPARYVSAGIAPPGRYSEWVDATNQHRHDPENPYSDVGINGYRSINEYKQYLLSKGIPLNIWKTIKLGKWERRLQRYNIKKNFSGAKSDPDPRVFPLYLKVVNGMENQDFDTLSDAEKIEFVMGRVGSLTDKQLDFAKRVGGYYNSLQFYDKIRFASRINDIEKIKNFLKNPDFSDENVRDLLNDASSKQEMAKLIIKHKPELSYKNIHDIARLIGIHHPNDWLEIAALIIENKPKLSEDDIGKLLIYSSRTPEIPELIIQKQPELSDFSVGSLLRFSDDKQKIAELIIKNKTELSNDNVVNLIHYPPKKQEIAKLIIQKRPDLSEEIERLISYLNGQTTN